MNFRQRMLLKRLCIRRVGNIEDTTQVSILDLPELAIESILTRLSADSLLQLAGVCNAFRKRCTSNHLWEALFEQKWGKIVGLGAYQAWKQFCSTQESSSTGPRYSRFWLWPFSCILSRPWARHKTRSNPFSDTTMALYWALENGSFWFPAQVYNREHGRVGFILSCYDAQLSYDRISQTFRARYPPHGQRSIIVEEGIPWERLRAPPAEMPASELQISNCLDQLSPGDHIEVQWRRNKELPYGWWYGVVGHADICRDDTRFCKCHRDDTVWLEFNQYAVGSRWRRAAINRRAHHEEGSESEGFYGGIRKLQTKEEISVWKKLWPSITLD